MFSAKPTTATLGLLLASIALADPAATRTPTRPVRVAKVSVTAEDRQALLTYRAQVAQELRAASSTPSAVAMAAPETPAAPTGCLLYQAGAEATPAQACLKCHDGSVAKAHLRTTHPVDLDYAMARYKNRDGLRPEEEVVRRGGFLPEGQLRCTTCHDARSPWAAKINLPPGAEVRPAVDPSNPSTYAASAPGARAQLAPGAEVSPKPLCLLCHAFN